MRKQSAIYSAPRGEIWSEPIQQLQQFGLNRCNGSVQPSRRFTDSRWRAVRIWIAEQVCSAQPIPVRPCSKRTRPGSKPAPRPRPEPGTGAGCRRRRQRRRARAWFPPNRARKLQVPKGTPFVPNFLYLNTTNFHPMANVGLNAFSYF